MEQRGKLLKDMAIIELKAFVYDLLAQQQESNRQLQIVQSRISELLSEPKNEENA